MIQILSRSRNGLWVTRGGLALAASLWVVSASVAQQFGDLVSRNGISSETYNAITRNSGTSEAVRRGMFETGLKATFVGANCHEVDDGWAISLAGRNNRGGDALHGGLDIVAPRGTPVLAVAAGEVVAKYLAERGSQGIQITLRHSPKDTGLPIWIYTLYTHLLELPGLSIGTRVRLGEVIARTSNTGRGSEKRRDALHFAVMYTDSPKYYSDGLTVIPQEGWWMDPHALYRAAPPYDSASMKALPASEKRIAVPYMLSDGTLVPADTKLIWPYACSTGAIDRGNPHKGPRVRREAP